MIDNTNRPFTGRVEIYSDSNKQDKVLECTIVNGYRKIVEEVLKCFGFLEALRGFSSLLESIGSARSNPIRTHKSSTMF